MNTSHSADRSALVAGLSIVFAQASILLGASLAKQVFPVVGPEAVAAMRTAMAAVILLALVRPWRTKLRRSDIGSLLLYGLALGGMNILIYWALQRIPIGIAVAIEICGPLALVLAGSRSLRDLMWFAMAAGGLALLIPWPGRDAPLDPLGIAFALGAALCWALYILFGRRASTIGGARAVTLGMVVACFVTVPAAVLNPPQTIPPYALGIGLCVAVLSNALPYMLEMRAFARLSSRVVGLLSSMSPASGAVIGYLTLGEQLTPLQWLAVVLTIAASAGASLSTRAPIAKPQDEMVA